ncbi:MAG: immunoglobulin domain-containing protein, partial [Limisphaerales bacterium]
VTNSISAALSAPATLNVVIPTVTETFFSDNFDSNSAGSWIVNSSSSDTRVTFFYNYANDGIPPAPNSSGGTARGVKFEANLANGTPAAINISPSGKSFTGDFDLKFDMWINANGPFPAGGTGSTEHLTAGLGTSGSRVQWGAAGNTADGTWFAVDGEGQAGDTTQAFVDFMIYQGTVQQSTNTGFYSAGTAGNARGNGHPYYASAFPGGQTAPAAQVQVHTNQTGALAVGSVGMKWRDVLITKRGNNMEWFIDGLRIASVTNALFSGNNIFVGYWDAFASLSSNPAMSFGLIDNLRVERTTEAVIPSFTLQPQPATVIQGGNVTFTASASGTTNLHYQWRLDGIEIPGATQTSYTINNVQSSHEGMYSVVVTNVAGKATSSNALLTVLVPPSIVAQPESISVVRGHLAELSVAAEGTQPLFYQWRFNGSPIAGETQASFTLPNVQPEHAGNYSVVVTNVAGSVTSDIAVLSVEQSPLRFSTISINEENQPSLTVSGAPGTAFSIQVSSNLVNWITVTNLVIGEGDLEEFVDEVTTTNTQRFYRATAVE